MARQAVKKTEENFYRRKPDKALKGMMGLTLEECGAYNILLDLMYQTWRPLPFHTLQERQWVVNWIPGAPQKVNPIVRRLIEKGRIKSVEIDGRTHLTDDLFETERAEVKPAKSAVKVGVKSGEVAEKSGKVAEKSPLLDPQNEENQRVAPTEKSQNKTQRKRKEKEEKEKPLSSVWRGDPAVRERITADQRFGSGWCLSYLDHCSVTGNHLRAVTQHAAAKLRQCPHLSAFRIDGPP